MQLSITSFKTHDKTRGVLTDHKEYFHSPSNGKNFKRPPEQIIAVCLPVRMLPPITGGCWIVPSHMHFTPEPPTGRVLLSGWGRDPLPCQIPITANDGLFAPCKYCIPPHRLKSAYPMKKGEIQWTIWCLNISFQNPQQAEKVYCD